MLTYFSTVYERSFPCSGTDAFHLATFDRMNEIEMTQKAQHHGFRGLIFVTLGLGGTGHIRILFPGFDH